MSILDELQQTLEVKKTEKEQLTQKVTEAKGILNQIKSYLEQLKQTPTAVETPISPVDTTTPLPGAQFIPPEVAEAPISKLPIPKWLLYVMGVSGVSIAGVLIALKIKKKGS